LKTKTWTTVRPPRLGPGPGTSWAHLLRMGAFPLKEGDTINPNYDAAFRSSLRDSKANHTGKTAFARAVEHPPLPQLPYALSGSNQRRRSSGDPTGLDDPRGCRSACPAD